MNWLFVLITLVPINAGTQGSPSSQPNAIPLYLNSIMSFNEQKLCGTHKLNSSELKHLDAWLKGLSVKLYYAFCSNEYSGEDDEHYISDNYNGKIIELEDGSIWLVDQEDRCESDLWLSSEEITLKANKGSEEFPYLMINTDTKSFAKTRLIEE